METDNYTVVYSVRIPKSPHRSAGSKEARRLQPEWNKREVLSDQDTDIHWLPEEYLSDWHCE